MLRILASRIRQGSRTIAFPAGDPPSLSDRFRGRPVIDAGTCPAECRACIDACPTAALGDEAGKLAVDLGRCLFCTACQEACPQEAIHYSQDFRLAVRQREHLHVRDETLRLAEKLDAKARALFGRSLKLRQVSAGGCNACEADVNVLSTIVFDLGRFGIQFVASPRHADGLLITGPVTKNMELALHKTYEAVPDPRLVIAVGACAISGGPYVDHPETCNGADSIVPVDLYVPGCPPHPLTILDGLLRLLGRIES